VKEWQQPMEGPFLLEEEEKEGICLPFLMNVNLKGPVNLFKNIMNSKLKRNDFIFLKTHGRKIRGKYFLILYSHEIKSPLKWAVIASKKVGNAVIRNYAKRCVREIVRERIRHYPVLPWFIVICFPFKEISFKERQQDLDILFSKLRQRTSSYLCSEAL
jgi:ribonuclease P protein component